MIPLFFDNFFPDVPNIDRPWQDLDEFDGDED